MEYEFVECETCSKKAGTPTLCKGCLNNRMAIYRLTGVIENQKDKLKVIETIIKL